VQDLRASAHVGGEWFTSSAPIGAGLVVFLTDLKSSFVGLKMRAGATLG
jgi:hypothetical protein